jgi:hypothetical protein
VRYHGWDENTSKTSTNAGITTGKVIHFHSLLEIPAVIEKALIQQGIVLRPGTKSKKYIET